MEKINLIGLLGLPESFGVTILVLCLIFTLAPYFSGADFGIFKIPKLATSLKSKLKIIAPLLFIFTIFLHIPFINSPYNISLQNPFGESQVLLNGQDLLFTKVNSNNANIDKLTYPKLLFEIDKVESSVNLKSELISTIEYAKLLDKNTGWVSLQNEIQRNPVLMNGKVFRIYQTNPFQIKPTKDSYEGIKVSTEKYLSAKNFVGNPFKSMSKFLDKDSTKKDEKTGDTNLVAALENMDIEELQKKVKDEFLEELGDNTYTLFNELSIVIVDKNEFELQGIAFNGGMEFQANPLFYLLNFGAILPYFNVQNVKNISVSRDSKVWAFYAERKLNNVLVNNELQKVVHTDFYRIYVANSEYIYQITLSYTPSFDTPRRTWDELVKCLKSLRINDI